jgi:hypothetical protein
MLQELNKYLTEHNFQSIFKPANENVYYDSLVVKYFAVVNGQNTFWPIEIGDLPFGDNSMKGFKIIQFYTPIVEDISNENYIKITDIITQLNPKLTFGNFGYLASHKLVFFKHNAILSDKNYSENFEIVHKTLLITFFMLENFQKAIADVALGKSTVSEAMESMPLNYIYQ